MTTLIPMRPEAYDAFVEDCVASYASDNVESHRWAQAPWWPVKSWAQVWIEHPEVRVRIGDSLYDLVATPLPAGEQRTAILAERGYDPVPDGIVLFRFDPRAPSAG